MASCRFFDQKLFVPLKDTTGENVIVGKGCYGRVYKGLYAQQEIVYKELKGKTSSSIKSFGEELYAMSELCIQGHSYVVSFITGAMFKDGAILVLEYLENLCYQSQFITNQTLPITLNQRLIIIEDILKGLEFIHSNNFVHCDLKPANIFLDNKKRAKIGDFGLALRKDEIMSYHHRGTPIFNAPEILSKWVPNSLSSDVYSFAATIWAVLTRWDPFYDYDKYCEYSEAIFKGIREPIPLNCPPIFRALIAQGWDGNPYDRPTAKQMLESLERCDEAQRRQMTQADVLIDTTQISSSLELFASNNPNNPRVSTYKIFYQNEKRFLKNRKTNYKTSTVALDIAKKEIATLAHLTDLEAPYVVRLIAHRIFDDNTQIIMEYAEYGDFNAAFIDNVYEALPIALAERIIKELVTAIAFIHANGYLHGNIHPENILLDKDKHVKVGGFSACLTQNHRQRVSCGEFEYSAPETMGLFPSTNNVQTDVYSMGMTMWSVVARKKFDCTEVNALSLDEFEHKMQSDVRPAIPDEFSNLIKQSITKAWQTDPVERPSAADLLKTLQSDDTQNIAPNPMNTLNEEMRETDGVVWQEGLSKCL